MKVCDILMKQGCVEEESIEKALKIQAAENRELEEILVEMGAVKESELSEAVGFQTDLNADRFSDKVSFLESIEPFNALTTQQLEEISATMAWKQFSAGEIILKEGGKENAFYILRNGLMKVFIDRDGEEKIIGFLGEGDFCGATALLSDGINPSNVVAIEQSLCLFQDGQSFAVMIQKYPRFSSFFNQLIVRQTRKIFTKLLTSGTSTIVEVEPFLYSKQVKDLVSPKQVFCLEKETIGEAAKKLVTADVGMAVVLDDENRLKGTLSLKRIVEASLLEGNDPEQPIDTILETGCHILRSDSFFFDALHEMIKKRTDSLIVLTGEKTEGVLTSLDLLKFRGREVLSLIRNIEDARSYSELNNLRQDVENVLRVLVADGALASHACKIVSELNDKVARRVIKLAEIGMGTPPLDYAWLGLGSEGRKEQTLLTDQDNAILFGDTKGGNSTAEEEYFRALSEKIVHGLDECGFPLCKGNIMATNPKYFGSLSTWKQKVDDWIGVQAPAGKDLVDIYTFLDFRAVYGNEALEEILRSHAIEKFRAYPESLRTLAQPILSVPIPLGFFKNFIVEKNGKYKNTVNIKIQGLLPLTTCAKLLAFYSGIRETNTLERIRGLVEREILSVDQGEFLEQSFETFLIMKIHNNLKNLDQGRDFSNNVNPSSLTIKQKQLLKDAFLAVSELQKITKEQLRVPG